MGYLASGVGVWSIKICLLRSERGPAVERGGCTSTAGVFPLGQQTDWIPAEPLQSFNYIIKDATQEIRSNNHMGQCRVLRSDIIMKVDYG